MKRRTLAYTPLAVKPFSHHAPDLDLSQFVVNNVMSAAAPVAASSTTGRTKKRKVFARTVNQKKEARRERRATSAMVGSVIRCRRGGDDDVDEEELMEDHHNDESTKENNSRDEKIPPVDDDTHEENSVIGDHTEEKSAAKIDDMEDSDATISMDDVNDHFDVDGIDNDVLLQADDDDDDAESNASTKNGGGGFLRGGDDSDSDESTTLEGKQLFRSSSSKKKQHMVIHDEEEEDDDESKVEDGATRVYVRHSKTTPKYTPRNKDHGGGGQSTTIRRSNRLGSSPVNTLINPDKKYSTDEDSDNEFTLSVTVRDNKKKRKVTASKCNKTRDNGKRSKISKIEHGKWVFVLSILKVVDCSLLGLMYLSFILTPHSIPPLFN
jgi:hypothetical protein